MTLPCQGGLFMVGVQYLLWAQLSDLMVWPTSTILHLGSPTHSVTASESQLCLCLMLVWTFPELTSKENEEHSVNVCHPKPPLFHSRLFSIKEKEEY